MLVISRQRDESAYVADGVDRIEFTIADIRGGKVRIGIRAPQWISIYRSELYQEIRETMKAGQEPPVSRIRGGDGMLVLSRGRDESIICIDNRKGKAGWEDPFCSLIVVDIRGGKVRLGFAADKTIPVHRKEVYDEIKRLKR